MTSAPEPVRGSLSARVIRACPEHQECALDCPRRTVEDLGEIAHFAETPGKEDSPWRRWFHRSARP